jgi:integrase/recombinase XerD
VEELKVTKTTLRNYANVLNDLKCYLEKRKINDIKQITSCILIDFFNTFLSKRIITSYDRNKITWVNKYFQYLEENQKIFISPMRDYTPPRYYRGSFPVLSRNEIDHILNNINATTPFLIKGRAIIELMYSSALRPKEVCNLRLTDIDYKEGILFIEQAKCKKDRIIPVGKKALCWIEKYIQEVLSTYLRQHLKDYVFIGKNTGRQFSNGIVWYMIKRTLILCGLKTIKPYSLRRTSATQLLLNGMPVEYIRILLGHAELRTTQIYLKVERHELDKVLKEKHPRNLNSKAIKDKF